MNRGLSRVAHLRSARRARGKRCCDPSPPRERRCSQRERKKHPKSGPSARFHRSEGVSRPFGGQPLTVSTRPFLCLCGRVHLCGALCVPDGETPVKRPAIVRL
jgi:hypothetical protein